MYGRSIQPHNGFRAGAPIHGGAVSTFAGAPLAHRLNTGEACMVPALRSFTVNGSHLTITAAWLQQLPPGNTLAQAILHGDPLHATHQGVPFVSGNVNTFREAVDFYANGATLPEGLPQADASRLKAFAQRFALADLFLACDTFYPIRRSVRRAKERGDWAGAESELQRLHGQLVRHHWLEDAQNVAGEIAELQQASWQGEPSFASPRGFVAAAPYAPPCMGGSLAAPRSAPTAHATWSAPTAVGPQQGASSYGADSTYANLGPGAGATPWEAPAGPSCSEGPTYSAYETALGPRTSSGATWITPTSGLNAKDYFPAYSELQAQAIAPSDSPLLAPQPQSFLRLTSPNLAHFTDTQMEEVCASLLGGSAGTSLPSSAPQAGPTTTLDPAPWASYVASFEAAATPTSQAGHQAAAAPAATTPRPVVPQKPPYGGLKNFDGQAAKRLASSPSLRGPLGEVVGLDRRVRARTRSTERAAAWVAELATGTGVPALEG